MNEDRPPECCGDVLSLQQLEECKWCRWFSLCVTLVDTEGLVKKGSKDERKES